MGTNATIRIESRDGLSAVLGNVLARLDHQSRRGWRHDVERARSALGARCSTVHVTEGEWLGHWFAGMDPASAVVTELVKVAD